MVATIPARSSSCARSNQVTDKKYSAAGEWNFTTGGVETAFLQSVTNERFTDWNDAIWGWSPAAVPTSGNDALNGKEPAGMTGRGQYY